MKYLAETDKGMFLVEAKDWQEALDLLRLSGNCGREELPRLITAFTRTHAKYPEIQKAMIKFHTS